MPYAPDSTEPGYLGPTTLSLPEGKSWEDFLHDVIAGITDLDTTLVRPRWQIQPPTTPSASTNWCAFGAISVEADYEPWINHHGTDPAHDQMQRMEVATIMVSFYGPNAEENAGELRDGLFVDQNRALFRANAVGIVEAQSIVRAAELFRQQFRGRSDLTLRLRREVRRNYNVQNLLRSKGPITANRPMGSASVLNTEFDTDNADQP